VLASLTSWVLLLLYQPWLLLTAYVLGLARFTSVTPLISPVIA
jgi:hypothetical protein